SKGRQPLAESKGRISSLAKEDALSSYHFEGCVRSEYTQSRMA
nr:hypothetical protein [Tanacetum cinerariifolium]